MKKMWTKVIGISLALLLLAGCSELNYFLSSYYNNSSSATSINIIDTSLCTGEVVTPPTSTSTAPTTANLMVNTMSGLYQQISQSTVMVNACYLVQDQENYYITSGFVHSKADHGDGTYTYYLVSNVTGLFHYTATSTGINVEKDGVFEFVFGDGSRYLGQLVGSFDNFDISVFSFTTSDVIPIPTFGDSDLLAIGDEVGAIGTPTFGEAFINSLVRGVVSGVNRRQFVSFTFGTGLSAQSYDITDYSVFQFDAPVNGGMEGGPIFNMNGEIIGILSYKYVDSTSDTTFESISFGIAYSDVQGVIQSIINTGSYTRPTIGISIYDVNLMSSADKTTNGVPSSVYNGVFIESVANSSPAKAAGMTAGEVLVSFDGVTIKNISSLASQLIRKKAGDQVTVQTINSLGTTKTYTLHL